MQERSIIERIGKRYPRQVDGLLKGIGDDCAVIADSGTLCWLLSSDLLVEDTHFIHKWHDPYLLGRKSVAVNISDIAAMGGTPRFLLSSLVLPPHISEEWLESWQDGVKSMLDMFSCTLIGGDVSRGKHLVIDIMVIGRMHPDHVVYRSGAAAGDDIYVSGNLGSSAAGLTLLKNNRSRELDFTDLIDTHFNPQPQVEVGRLLAKKRLASSMQDISDGIATDLSHICVASNISSRIEAKRIPMDEKVIQVANLFSTNPLEYALYGGEDYQLLFTSHPKNRQHIQEIALQTKTPLTRIGQTLKGPPRVVLEMDGQEEDITFRGFEHT